MKRKKLPLDPYGSTITLLWGTCDELNAYLRRTLGSDYVGIRPAARAHTTEWTPIGKAPIHYVSIVTDKSVGKFEMLGALAHELIHVALAILEFRGIKLESANDEPIAYYYEWLFRNCARELW